VRLVGPEGEQVGIVRIEDALRLAQESELDLVEVAPMARPPVAKLMDYGKFKYESAQKAREARRNQALTVIKEMKLRPKIDPHDYSTKKGHVERFLRQGDKVKVTIMFRGREQSRPELGFRLLQRLADDIQELGFVESSPKQDGRGPAQERQGRACLARAVAPARDRRLTHPRVGRHLTRSGASLRGEPLHHAEEQDAQRHRQAGQGHRHRQAAAPAHQPPSPARTQAEHPHPAAGRHDRHRAAGREARP
jgi:translation initiation factor IF-3